MTPFHKAGMEETQAPDIHSPPRVQEQSQHPPRKVLRRALDRDHPGAMVQKPQEASAASLRAPQAIWLADCVPGPETPSRGPIEPGPTKQPPGVSH